ncbi:MAG: hypothetical protein ACREHC_01325 [Candidatus Levyibacteriota bacterium]
MTKKVIGAKGGSAYAQPMDPTKSGEDFIGDTTGLTGITTGSASKTSATPQDQPKDHNKNHLPGGTSESQTNDSSHGRLSPNINIDDEKYNKETLAGMSQVQRDIAEDIATESDLPSSDTRTTQNNSDDDVPYTVNRRNASGDDSPGSDELNTESAPYYQPENLGEQAISGSAPDPTADDDTLEVAHAAGTQLKEKDNLENPQPVDLAEDVDRAEAEIRES